MAIPVTSGSFKTDINSMNIGDCIACKYTASSGTVGTFSGLGTALATAQANEIPVASTASPNGYFYFIKSNKGLLIADRVVQSTISWNALNAKGYIQGFTTPMLSRIDQNVGLNYNKNYSAGGNGASVPFAATMFGDDLYVAWHEQTSLGQYMSNIRIKKYDSSHNWISVDNGGISYSGAITVNGGAPKVSLTVFNNELYAFWVEAPYIRAKKFVKETSTWISIDNNSGLGNIQTERFSDPVIYNGKLYISYMGYINSYMSLVVICYDGTSWTTITPAAGLHYIASGSGINSTDTHLIWYNGQLHAFWYEYNGSYIILRSYRYDGTNWIASDNGSSGLSALLGANAYVAACCPVIINGTLYLFITAYNQSSSSYYIGAIYFNGTSWVSYSANLVGAVSGSPNMMVTLSDDKVFITCTETSGGAALFILPKTLNSYYYTSLPSVYGNKTGIANVVALNSKAYVLYDDTFTYSSYPQKLLCAATLNYVLFRSPTSGCAYLDSNGNPSTTDKGLGAWPANNEWDKYIKAGDVWNCAEWSLNQDTTINGFSAIIGGSDNTYRTLRGGSLINKPDNVSVALAGSNGGFRPILEYIDNDKSINLFY